MSQANKKYSEVVAGVDKKPNYIARYDGHILEDEAGVPRIPSFRPAGLKLDSGSQYKHTRNCANILGSEGRLSWKSRRKNLTADWRRSRGSGPKYRRLVAESLLVRGVYT